jgi:tight adherence protein C
VAELLAFALDFQFLLPLAVFGAIAAAAWWLLDVFAVPKSRAAERLEEIKDPLARRRNETGAAVKRTDAVTKVLEQATPALARPLLPQSEADKNNLKLKLDHAGFRSEAAPTIYLGIRFLMLVMGLVLGGGTILLTTGFSQTSLIRLVIVAGAMFYLPEALLWWITRKRKEAIFLGLPDALDLMVVCVEAGLGLDQAMRKVADEMKKSYRILSDEFALCNFQLQVGKTRAEVLHDLGQRTGVEDLSSLASILIQADKFGSSIAHALRVQSDSMRTRRRQLAEEKAAKTAVKLIFPLVIFIFPGIFVVLVGPAAITMIREMFPAMSGQR